MTEQVTRIDISDLLIFDHRKANCRGTDPVVFDSYGSHKQAVRVCSSCEIVTNCYYEAVVNNLSGTWGGAWFSSADDEQAPRKGGRGNGGEYVMRYHRNVLLRRLGMTLREFTAEYGCGKDGIRKALRQALGL